MNRSKRLKMGRMNWIVAMVLVMIVALFVVVFTSGESPTAAAQRFMIALSTRDVNTLTDLSYFNPARPAAEIEKDWKKTTTVGMYYKYAYKIVSDARPTPDRATVKMQLARNADQSGSYDENFSLDLIRVNGKWLVDVRSISREMYPALPR